MNILTRTILIAVLAIGNFSACTQQTHHIPIIKKTVGGPCEGCEALLDYGNRILNSTDTIPGFEEFAPKLSITGTVYQADGITPAENIILYFYQTNRGGIYKPNPKASGWAKTHGQHRGWVKTNNSGEYTLYTFRPAAYPNRREPEHIHLTVEEPETNAYYLDSFVFDDDPLLTNSKRDNLLNRGGSGIMRLQFNNGLFVAKRDIILGLNIPDYPVKSNSTNELKSESNKADTIAVNLKTSVIQWKGTKLKGLGKHEGEVSLQSAFLLQNDQLINGGEFVLNMNSISVTDIPESEPVPRKNLTNHLKDKDFFAVDEHPFSYFKILNTNRLNADSLLIRGNLTIKGITKSVSFTALRKEDSIDARFHIDRYRWEIYTDSSLNSALLDREIEFRLEIKLSQ